MFKNSYAFYGTEIHRVDSPYSEDSKSIFFLGQKGPNFGGGKAAKFTENGQTQGNLLLCKSGNSQF